MGGGPRAQLFPLTKHVVTPAGSESCPILRLCLEKLADKLVRHKVEVEKLKAYKLAYLIESIWKV